LPRKAKKSGVTLVELANDCGFFKPRDNAQNWHLQIQYLRKSIAEQLCLPRRRGLHFPDMSKIRSRQSPMPSLRPFSIRTGLGTPISIKSGSSCTEKSISKIGDAQGELRIRSAYWLTQF
jgi:hypothetical protein